MEKNTRIFTFMIEQIRELAYSNHLFNTRLLQRRSRNKVRTIIFCNELVLQKQTANFPQRPKILVDYD